MQRGLPHCRRRPPASSSIAVRATSAAVSSGASAGPASSQRRWGGRARRFSSAMLRPRLRAGDRGSEQAADGLAQAVQAERGIERVLDAAVAVAEAVGQGEGVHVSPAV